MRSLTSGGKHIWFALPEYGQLVRNSTSKFAAGIDVRGVRVFESDDPRFDGYLRVTVDRPGDHSDYRICLVELDERGRPTGEPLAGFDPRYACLDFSFKAGCTSSLDCEPTDGCPEPERSRCSCSRSRRFPPRVASPHRPNQLAQCEEAVAGDFLPN